MSLAFAALGLVLLQSGLAVRAVDATELLRELASDVQAPRAAPTGSDVEALVWHGSGSGATETYHGLLYRGGGPLRAALVLVPGLDPAGGADPRVIAVARSLSRFGFTVLVPDFASFERLRIGPRDIGTVAATLRFLAGRPEAKGLPLGIAAISYAVGPAVLAALEPGLDHRIRFIVGFGGYYSSLAMVRFFTTGYFHLPGDSAWHHRRPNAYGKWVFVAANAGKIADPADRTTLMAMAMRKLRDPAAPIGDLAKTLGPEGRSVYDLIENREPARVPGLVAALPPRIRRDLRTLSLARADVHDLDARLILIHNRGDRIIPYGESLALAKAVPNADVYLTSERQHMSLEPRDFLDALTLWRATYRLLGQRREVKMRSAGTVAAVSTNR